MPFEGPIAGTRVGYVNGEFVLYPTYKGIAEESDLNLVFAATRDAMVMVEGGGNLISEADMLEAIFFAHEAIQPLIDIQLQLQ